VIIFKDVVFDKVQCQKELDEVKLLFNGCPDIEETKGSGGYSKGLQGIFEKRLQLFALMGKIVFGEIATKWNKEVKFGDFRADFIIANNNEKKVCLIEFENAKTDSIFKQKTHSDSTVTFEWSPKFDHGYSQILDWKYYAMEEKESVKKDFSQKPKEIEFALFIGWNKYLQQSNFQERFDFRKDKVTIESKAFYCMCFDSLIDELQEKLNLYNSGL
jgi:hypothetical protein